MKNIELLQYAIAVAQENGFDEKGLGPYELASNVYFNEDGMSLFDLIYRHDFAKALWGNEWMPGWLMNRMREYGRGDVMHSWQMGPEPWKYHLQQMVIAKDPIRYLSENI